MFAICGVPDNRPSFPGPDEQQPASQEALDEDGNEIKLKMATREDTCYSVKSFSASSANMGLILSISVSTFFLVM